MRLSIRRKLIDFYKKHKWKILIGLIIWAIVIVTNYVLVALREDHKPTTTYEKHSSILETKETVPQSLQSPIEDLIGEYIGYCNNKEYKKAYNMLSEEYKTKKKVTLKMFTEYIDTIFNTKKIYNIQNYSNLKGIYIYNVRILDDIMATGLTGEDALLYIEEKVVIKNEKGGLKLSIGAYVGTEALNKVYENEHMKITVIEKTIEYSTESYLINIVNRTDNVIVIKDIIEVDQIVLGLGDVNRAYTKSAEMITIEPEATLVMSLVFDKFADDERTAKTLSFNNIKIFEEYDWYDFPDPLRKYSIEIKL